tara:strand:- start:24 stop:551 length:528 start_codon:yes stop_codon:yes gene_type:complete
VAQEFFINSQGLEDKIRQLLPSQGGAGAGFDLSASTQIIPIIDLTESAEGSGLRQDLQSSLSHGSISSFVVANATTTIISNTGYWRVFGAISATNIANALLINISISDGSTDKIILDGHVSSRFTNEGAFPTLPFDFIVYLKAGDSLKAISNDANLGLAGCTRQLADIDGVLVNP